MARTVTDAQLTAWLAKAQEVTNTDYSKFMPERMDMAPVLHFDNITGRNKFARILTGTKETQRMCWGFINLENGDVLKADGWKKPALNFARGNIADTSGGLARVKWTGVY